MGLFSFLKSVGEKITGKSEETPKAEDVKKALDAHNLGTDKVQVTVDNDKVILSGEVKDQATLEKAILAAGNTLGIAEVDSDNLRIPSGETRQPVFYTVKSGDTLWKIAEAQYGKGNGKEYNKIFEANQPLLTSPDKIYPGQSLRIPPLS